MLPRGNAKYVHGTICVGGREMCINVITCRMKDGEVFKLVLALDQSEKLMGCNVIGFV